MAAQLSRRWRALSVASVAVLLVIGCGPSQRTGATDSPAAAANGRTEPIERQSLPSEPTDAVDAPTGGVDEEQAAPHDRLSPEKDLYGWDNFPLDVYFEDPFAQLDEDARPEPAPGSRTRGADRVDGQIERPVSQGSAQARGRSFPTDAAAGPLEWSEIIPVESVVEEVKRARQQLNARMETIGDYNRAYREVRIEATALAVMTGIAVDHAGPISWKPRALHIRDLASKVASSARGLGPRSYTPARNAYDKVRSLLDDRDANLDGLDPDPLREMPWANVADRSQVMRRMKRAQEDGIQRMATDAATFRKNAEEIAHEAAVLAALAEVICGSYDDAEDEGYLRMARSLRDQSIELARAARGGQFEAVAELVAANTKRCNECHKQFRFDDVGF